MTSQLKSFEPVVTYEADYLEEVKRDDGLCKFVSYYNKKECGIRNLDGLDFCKHHGCMVKGCVKMQLPDGVDNTKAEPVNHAHVFCGDHACAGGTIPCAGLAAYVLDGELLCAACTAMTRQVDAPKLVKLD
jgi:hypothetical protein